MKFVSDLRQVSGFFRVFRFPQFHSISTPEFNFHDTITNLLHNSLAHNTKQTYERGLMALYEFRQRFALPHIWPVPLVDLCNFVAYLFQAQLSHSSINCYLSGISFLSKINDLEDSTQKFVVRKMLEGVKLSKKKNKVSRLPVTLNTLKMILKNLHLVCSSKYETTLFSAAFSV
jgi:site-specific recombinase XerC